MIYQVDRPVHRPALQQLVGEMQQQTIFCEVFSCLKNRPVIFSSKNDILAFMKLLMPDSDSAGNPVSLRAFRTINNEWAK